MMRKIFLAIMIFILAGVGGLTTVSLSEDVPAMAKDELKAILGNPDLMILDVRDGSDYFSSDLKIKGADRPNGGYVGSNISQFPKDKTIVVYCASPHERKSTSIVQRFIKNGYTKVYVLKGGWEEWLKANYPTEKK